jgi:hypothetical protein
MDFNKMLEEQMRDELAENGYNEESVNSWIEDYMQSIAKRLAKEAMERGLED